jgi:hypothetical protein
MKGSIHLTAAVVAVALLALPAQAIATHVQCGSVITQTTSLDSDVVCADTGSSFYVGVSIQAPDVTLWMNGYTISSEAGFGSGVQAVPATGEYSNVHVRGGTLEGWTTAVEMIASDSSVRRVSATGIGNVISMVGDRNYAYRNVVEVSETGSGSGIFIEGDDAYTWGNTLRGLGLGTGVISQGDRPRHVLNTVEACGAFGGTGIVAEGYSTFAVLNRNTVSDCPEGVVARSAPTTSGGAFVRLNETTGGSVGVRIDDPGAVVGRNTATGASDTGILIDVAGTTVQNNAANDNGNYGIFGPVGTIDGGGNTATGNGDGSTPQCVNVACAAP